MNEWLRDTSHFRATLAQLAERLIRNGFRWVFQGSSANKASTLHISDSSNFRLLPLNSGSQNPTQNFHAPGACRRALNGRAVRLATLRYRVAGRRPPALQALCGALHPLVLCISLKPSIIYRSQQAGLAGQSHVAHRLSTDTRSLSKLRIPRARSNSIPSFSSGRAK